MNNNGWGVAFCENAMQAEGTAMRRLIVELRLKAVEVRGDIPRIKLTPSQKGNQ